MSMVCLSRQRTLPTALRAHCHSLYISQLNRAVHVHTVLMPAPPHPSTSTPFRQGFPHAIPCTSSPLRPAIRTPAVPSFSQSTSQLPSQRPPPFFRQSAIEDREADLAKSHQLRGGHSVHSNNDCTIHVWIAVRPNESCSAFAVLTVT